MLLHSDPIDEFVFKNLEYYDGQQLVNVGVGSFKLPGENEEYQRKKAKKLRKIFKPLLDWWKNLLESEIEEVRISSRLVEDPAVIIS